MQIRALMIVSIVWISSFGSLGPIAGQQVTSLPQLFKQLQSEQTSDQATAEFMKLGPKNQRARDFLIQHLPSVIAREPSGHYVWLNSVRLAGKFQIVEAAPGLIKWINAASEAGGTLTEVDRLDPFPCARALVQIGEPAVPALTEALEKGDYRHQWVAYRVLITIGSPRAIKALRDHVQHEPNPDFKSEIQKALAAR